MRISDWSSDVCSSDLPRRRDEGLADAAAVLAADRDVLQVGIARRQAPGRRARLVVAGVHAAGVGIDHLRQLVGVGAAQFRRSEEHTSELQSLMRISYAVFCLKKTNNKMMLIYIVEYQPQTQKH